MRHSFKKQNGFSLVEVLISLLIIGVGLLGLGGMQIASVKGTNDAHYRTTATMMAMSLADRMRANPQGVSTGDGYKQAPSSCGAVVSCDTKKCSSSEMVAFDLNQIMCDMNGTLINGKLAVSCTGGDCTASNVKHFITISWEATNIHKDMKKTKLSSKKTQTFSLTHEVIPR